MKKTKEQKQNPPTKVVLSDATKKTKKDSAKTKRSTFSGKDFDTLKQKDKDDLFKALLIHLDWMDSNNILK